jgi:hypothetical protein
MTTFPLRAPQLPEARWPLPRFSKLVSGVKSVLDLLAEVDRMVWEARERYPFAD